MSIIGTSDLDFMLSEFGGDVVFAGGVTTKGLLDRDELLENDGNGFGIAGARTSLFVRDGTQPAGLREDQTVTVTDPATGIAGSYIVRDTGMVQADGLRKLTIVEV